MNVVIIICRARPFSLSIVHLPAPLIPLRILRLDSTASDSPVRYFSQAQCFRLAFRMLRPSLSLSTLLAILLTTHLNRSLLFASIPPLRIIMVHFLSCIVCLAGLVCRVSIASLSHQLDTFGLH